MAGSAGGTCRRFNGAALSEARKPCHQKSNPMPKKASMGPRFRKRGNIWAGQGNQQSSMGFNGAALSEARKLIIDNFHRAVRRSLQWGRAFGSAETRVAAARTCRRRRMLQWGRAFGSAETVNPITSRRPLPIASMGPRFRKRGNDRAECDSGGRAIRFNGAALSEARKRGNCRTRAGIAPASMGPRFRKRGNGD